MPEGLRALSESTPYFAVRGGSLSQLRRGGRPRRTDSSWQPVVQAGARRDEAGGAWRQTGPSGRARRLGRRVGSAALPTFDFAFLPSPRPRGADPRFWGSCRALLKGRGHLGGRVAVVVQVQLTCAGSPGARRSKLFHSRAWGSSAEERCYGGGSAVRNIDEAKQQNGWRPFTNSGKNMTWDAG